MRSPTTIDLGSVPLQRADFLVKDLMQELEYVRDSITETACENIVTKIVDTAGDYADMLNSVAPRSGTSGASIERVAINNVGEISLSGADAVYDEFGTGSEGARNPHPLKENFPLNPYNSGPHIFYNQFANKYQWIYPPMAGRPYFTATGLTEGIPSGKQMYNTLQYIRRIKDEIVAEEINNALKTLK